MLKFWLLADIHTRWGDLIPPKNIDGVIIAGDLATTKDPVINSNELRDGLNWLDALPYKYKIFVPGNHDTSFEKGLVKREDYPNIHILVDQAVSINGINFYGSPRTPSFGYGWAYNVDRYQIEMYWQIIPDDTHILITHGPPFGILDETYGAHYGDNELRNRVEEFKPIYHIFGHFHNEKGATNSMIFSNGNTTFINASVVDLRHNLVNNGKIIGIE